MASLHTSLASHTIGVLRRPSSGIHGHSLIIIASARHNLMCHLNLRSGREVRVQAKNRWSPVFALNSNPSDDTKPNDAASGPPFLTILAGVVVLLFICWIIGSIVMWFLGLILHPPPLK